MTGTSIPEIASPTVEDEPGCKAGKMMVVSTGKSAGVVNTYISRYCITVRRWRICMATILCAGSMT